ncbi:hypothetical protein FAIPA1_20029 [Frankia sp. AiPs1]
MILAGRGRPALRAVLGYALRWQIEL